MGREMAPGTQGPTGMAQPMGMAHSMAHETTAHETTAHETMAHETTAHETPPTEPLTRTWIRLASADGVTETRSC